MFYVDCGVLNVRWALHIAAIAQRSFSQYSSLWKFQGRFSPVIHEWFSNYYFTRVLINAHTYYQVSSKTYNYYLSKQPFLFKKIRYYCFRYPFIINNCEFLTLCYSYLIHFQFIHGKVRIKTIKYETTRKLFYSTLINIHDWETLITLHIMNSTIINMSSETW